VVPEARGPAAPAGLRRAAGLLLLVPVGLIMKQPDLGTSLLVLAAGLSVIFFAGLSWKLVCRRCCWAVGLVC
jgi:cell division protein FtsW (lipid II flippase)